MNATELRQLVEGRGHRLEPIHNDLYVAEHGGELVVMGYRLIGPRGNRYTAVPHPEKGYDRFLVQMWLEGIDYATGKLKPRKVG